MFPLYDNNPHRRVPWFTLLIIAINVGVFFYETTLTQPELVRFVAQYGFTPARIEQLSNPNLLVKANLDGHAVVFRADPAAIYTSAVTMMFLHGGLWHLAGNMWFLWIFGNNVEDRLGHLIFLLFYLLGGLLGTAGHYFSEPQSTIPAIGASGAVAAVLGAYAVTFPTAKVRTLVFIFLVDLPALLVLGFWFLGEVVKVQLGDETGVALWAHIGGFIAGMLLMPILALGAPPPDKDWRAEAEESFKL